jgi:hypothetical protein
MPDPNPFSDCDVIVCYGEAKLADRHLGRYGALR